jgi:N-acetylglucosaminyldiphosphoundecaprenol N-acetyl-beta-D-mannosaminyltransferase
MPFRELLAPDTITDVLPEKISGIDLIQAICGSDFAAGKKLYLLGAGEGVAKRTGEILERKYPGIIIAGAEEGIRKGFSEEENNLIIERMNAASPDILLVALGSPKQEKWIHENLLRLSSVRVAMGVGGSFDVISGKIRRAPRIFQERGMEWLWRLIREPRRLRRIFHASFGLAWLIFKDKTDKI